MRRSAIWSLTALLAMMMLPVAAQAERISNPIAVFTGLDKTTAKTKNFEVAIGQDALFGEVRIKAFACYTRSITEQPKTTAFVQIFDHNNANNKTSLFSGWMFAESPALNAFEHPVVDVWLTACRDPNAPPPVVEVSPQTEDGAPKLEEEPQD
jgi:hypothetical protein